MACYQLLNEGRLYLKMEADSFRLSDYMLDMACPPAAVPQQLMDDDGSSIWRKATPINKEIHLLEDWFVFNGMKKRHTTMNADGYAEGHYREWYMNGLPRLSVWYMNGRVTGDFRIWYSNGQLAASCIVDAEDRGLYKGWHRNGRRRC